MGGNVQKMEGLQIRDINSSNKFKKMYEESLRAMKYHACK